MADAQGVLERLVAATNGHDLDALVGCFAAGYVNETPAHPPRGFRGHEQVRRNWSAIFAAVPDIRARVVAAVVDGDVIWTEWEMTGTRVDGAPHAMAGVVVFRVAGDEIVAARFFLEPVESDSGDADAALRRLGVAP
jgi:ketosteroid isomerase-like protein